MKNIFKVLSLFLLVYFTITLSSCDGEENDLLNNFIRFKADGVQMQISDQTNVFGFSGQSGGQFTMQIQGSTGAEDVVILIYDDQEITTITYEGFEINANNVIEGIVISYTSSSRIDYTTDITNMNGSVAITEITSTIIKGNFEGLLRDPESGNVVVIADGEFAVKRFN